MQEPTLDQLHDQSAKLYSRIMATRHVPTRKRLITERAKIIGQIRIRTEKKDRAENLQYSKKTDVLINENKELIYFSVNGRRVQIGKDNEVEVTFSPCGHTRIFHIKHFLTNYRIAPNHRERATFDRLQDLMTRNISYSSAENCQQCRKDQQKRFNLLRRRQNKPIGTFRWTLRKLQ